MSRTAVLRGSLLVGSATIAATAATLGVLVVEARMARRWVGPPRERAPTSSGWYGYSAAEPIHLATLGDSSVAGVGVAYGHETMAAILAAGLAAVSGRPVRLSNVGVSGARTADLWPQVVRVLADPPDVALICVGANDVTKLVSPRESAAQLAMVVRRLRDRGVRVVVGTCPDLGTVRPIPPPLRQLALLWSRRLARAQAAVVVRCGGRAVIIGSVLGSSFAVDPLLWGPDRYHPSADGYAAAASALLPAVAWETGVWATRVAPPGNPAPARPTRAPRWWRRRPPPPAQERDSVAPAR